MKKLVPVFSLAVLMVACTSTPNSNSQANNAAQTQTAPAYNSDTAGLAQFQQWKAENERAAITAYTAAITQPVAVAPVRKASKARTTTASRPSGASQGSSTVSSNSEGGTLSSESANAAKAPEKRGWSKAAKGAAIGAGTGAVAGAVINKKNRVVGGVLGGVVGGAVGYGIGRHMDKQDGRY